MIIVSHQNDWRIRNQAKYLLGKKMVFQNYLLMNQSWDHDHCEFCWKKFPEECDKGYATEDKYYWVCPSCFEDFKDMFNWKIESE